MHEQNRYIPEVSQEGQRQMLEGTERFPGFSWPNSQIAYFFQLLLNPKDSSSDGQDPA